MQFLKDREDYLDRFPPPFEAFSHGLGSDIQDDLPLLWSAASFVRPELILELGTREGMSTRTLAHAARQWDGRVVTVDPVDVSRCLNGVDCEFIQAPGEELHRRWTDRLKFMFIDTDPHSYDQTRMWLDTWVKDFLSDSGVAVFHDMISSRPEICVADAVRDWLEFQPKTWHWQELPGTCGLGLLWRLVDSGF